ncbi:STT3 domain-containing protein [uncultured Pseudodesulfovibrio sp.]|uniref:STT3 domain-containing protein n=1 Tax=uncultured Pseudodesulfovibrio sp. TaxID=2035858 RepID=UPI0029C93428|nr:STT3 domain-containing protein [uncultured Pseudodesulfovibrio sp.]
MEAVKRVYLKGLDAVGEMPSWSRDWRWIAIYSFFIYAIVLAFRLSFAGRWDHPELWVNGERILATHDAYFWLAKAKGVGVLKGYPLAEAADLIHRFTGIGLGTIGFWAPAFMGALVGVVCYLWGWLLAGRNAGIFAGLVGSLTPGFFYRSRLGYFDTDMFTLLVPMAVAWMLAFWVSHFLKRGWFFTVTGESDERATVSYDILWQPFAFGLLTRFGCMWHNYTVSLCVGIFFLAALVLAVNGRRGEKVLGFYGLTVFLLAAFPGSSFGDIGSYFWLTDLPFRLEIFYVLLSVVLAVSLVTGHRFKLDFLENRIVCIALLLCCVWLSEIAQAPLSKAFASISYYLYPAKVHADSVISAGVVYPSIMQSVIEAKLTSLTDIFGRGAFTYWLGALAIIFFACIALFRPVAVFLVPLLALHLLGVKLGARFTMFGGAAMMVFLSVGLYWAANLVAKKLVRRRLVVFTLQIVLGLFLLGYSYFQYSTLPLTPVLPKAHAEALAELEKQATKDSMIWTWWDWGYASQYYAGLESTVDGGQHSGKDAYPTALVLSTDSPRQANQMIRLTSQYKRRRGMGYDIASEWSQHTGAEVMAEIEGLKGDVASFSAHAPQYFVVTWKDIRISKWISYFGNWNLETGSTIESSVSNYEPGELGINFQRGAVMNRQGGGGLVKDITVLDWDKADTTDYFMNSMSARLLPVKQHLVVNKVSRQSVLMDRIGYRSMMTRLLVGDPSDPEISKYFRLVVDKLPFARIYEVIQSH